MASNGEWSGTVLVSSSTKDASTSIITKGASAAELLVNLTRGRHENLLFSIGHGDDEFAGGQLGDIKSRVAGAIRVRRRVAAVRASPTQADDEFQLGL